MSTLSDLLAIPHFTTSSGGTVRRDFIEAVARALGATDADFIRPADDERSRREKNKDEVLALAWELARGEPMPREERSEGETITNPHLERIIEGVVQNGLGPMLEGADADHNGGFQDLEDERRRRVAERTVRDGQGRFRAAVLEAYSKKCAVTGADLPAVLEAAHISPYMGPASNRVSNALCLRSDIHKMFDRHMLAIDEVGLTVLLTPAVRATEYRGLDGVRIDVPRSRVDRPNREALAHHRLAAGFN